MTSTIDHLEHTGSLLPDLSPMNVPDLAYEAPVLLDADLIASRPLVTACTVCITGGGGTIDEEPETE